MENRTKKRILVFLLFSPIFVPTCLLMLIIAIVVNAIDFTFHDEDFEPIKMWIGMMF